MIVNIFAVEKPRKMKNVMDDIKYMYTTIAQVVKYIVWSIRDIFG